MKYGIEGKFYEKTFLSKLPDEAFLQAKRLLDTSQENLLLFARCFFVEVEDLLNTKLLDVDGTQ